MFSTTSLEQLLARPQRVTAPGAGDSPKSHGSLMAQKSMPLARLTTSSQHFITTLFPPHSFIFTSLNPCLQQLFIVYLNFSSHCLIFPSSPPQTFNFSCSSFSFQPAQDQTPCSPFSLTLLWLLQLPFHKVFPNKFVAPIFYSTNKPGAPTELWRHLSSPQV